MLDSQLCLMSLLALWIAPGFHLCLLVYAQKLCLYSFVVGTSVAKQLGQVFIVLLKEPSVRAEPSFPALSSLSTCKRRIRVVPVVC